MSRRPRILFVTHWLPRDRSIGAAQRSGVLLEGLRACGDCEVVVFDPPQVPESERERLMREEGVLAFVASVPRARPFEFPLPSLPARLVERWQRARDARRWREPFGTYEPLATRGTWRARGVDLARYDVIVSRYLMWTSRLGLIGEPRLVLDVDDDERQVLRSKLAAPHRSGPPAAVIEEQLRQLESLVAPLFEKAPELLLSNANDLPLYAPARATWVPNIPERPTHMAPPATSQRLFTIGTGLWPPYVDGVDWFLAAVWPEVRRHLPEARFAIAGRGIAPDTRQRWSGVAGVEVLGDVPDVASPLAAAAGAVVSNWYGGGTTIKLLEALGHGRPVVATAFAAAAHRPHLDHERGLTAASDAAAMARACIAILRDPTAGAARAARGRAVLDELYTRSAVHAALRTVVERVAR